MTRSRHKVQKEIETAERVIDAGGVADIETLRVELSELAHKKESTRGEKIAIVSGTISGIPDSLARAVDALRDVIARCERARATDGILDERQAMILTGIEVDVSTLRKTLEIFQSTTHAMHMAGIGIEKADEMELL